jgi:CheY-like chemotaxis protein
VLQKKIIEYEEINSLTHTPIIALTANALKGDKEKFLSAGMDEYLTKPIKEELLLDILDKFGIKLNIKKSTSSKYLLSSNKKENSTKTITKTKKDILIYKKSTVETKIFQKVLSSVYQDIDIAENTEDFINLLNKNSYKAILLDKELQDIDTDRLIELKEQHNSSAFILFRNFETRVNNKLRAIFDETIINSADKGYLQTVLDNYIKI